MFIHICIHITAYFTHKLFKLIIRHGNNRNRRSTRDEEETEGTEEDIIEGETEGTEEETEELGLSSFIIFLYCPCCFLECAIISAVLLYSSSVF